MTELMSVACASCGKSVREKFAFHHSWFPFCFLSAKKVVRDFTFQRQLLSKVLTVQRPINGKSRVGIIS